MEKTWTWWCTLTTTTSVGQPQLSLLFTGLLFICFIRNFKKSVSSFSPQECMTTHYLLWYSASHYNAEDQSSQYIWFTVQSGISSRAWSWGSFAMSIWAVKNVAVVGWAESDLYKMQQDFSIISHRLLVGAYFIELSKNTLWLQGMRDLFRSTFLCREAGNLQACKVKTMQTAKWML